MGFKIFKTKMVWFWMIWATSILGHLHINIVSSPVYIWDVTLGIGRGTIEATENLTNFTQQTRGS